MRTLDTPAADRILPGILLMIGFCMSAPLLDVAAKLAARTLPVGQITAARFVIQAALMLPVCLWLGLRLRPGPGTTAMLLWRALFLVLSTYFFIAAIRVMPIADALAIVFVEPFIILFVAKYLFGDEIGPRRIGAAVVGFAGALLVIQPSLHAFGAVALLPLGTAVSFAAYMLITRGLSRRMHPVTMQFHTAAIAALATVPVVWLADGRGWPTLDPVMPEGLAWLWLLGVGGFAALSHMMMTQALTFAPSATLAPLHYLEIVMAATLGYLVFGNFPDLLTLAGIAVIMGAGLFVIHRERRISRADQATKAPPGSPV